MDELNIEELNGAISDLDFQKVGGIFFPPINMDSPKRPAIMCSLDERQEVRKFFFGKTRPDVSGIETDSYLASCICSFVLDKKTPQNEKNIVCNYLDEKFKMMIFETFITSEFKPQFKREYGSLEAEIYYSPKKNGVPIKHYYLKNNNLVSDKLDCSFSDIENILLGRDISNNSGGIMLGAIHLINESGVLNEPWCPQYIKELMAKYYTPWNDYENKMCNENNNLLKQDLEQREDAHHDVRVNENLKNMILSSVPSEYSTLEKTIYIYSKLCQILSYDSMYFVGKKKQYDKSVSKVANIDSNDNSVVCYNFSYILADLLMEIGITKIKEHKLKGDKFDDEHSNISFLIDGLVIFADSTRSVVQGDLTSLKYSSKMSGIRCELYDEESQKEFKAAKAKVAARINSENMQFNSMLPKKEDIENLSINERMIMFNNMIINSNLTNADFISYLNKLAEVLDINVSPQIYYNDETNNLFVQVNLCTIYGDPLKSYVIDSVTKRLLKQPNELEKLKA